MQENKQILADEISLRRMQEDFDVVFVNQLSPVMMAQPCRS